MWYLSLLVFKDSGFKYETYLCNGCSDLIQKFMNFKDVAIVSAKGSDYRIYFLYMSKDDALNIFKNPNLKEKKFYDI